MSYKVLLQYLEFLKLTGIQDIYFDKKPTVEINSSPILEDLRISYQNCVKCKLSEIRNHFVYGNGNQSATLMLIGEGPGEDEDNTGDVFVGKAGQLLTKMLLAIQLNRDEVYIANIVKCRPPGNRNPEKEEIQACLPYLLEQIEIIKPKLLLLLGRVAAVSLFHIDQPLAKYRKKPLYFQGIKTYISYHPSALLRNPNWKPQAWEDLKKVRVDYQKLKK